MIYSMGLHYDVSFPNGCRDAMPSPDKLPGMTSWQSHVAIALAQTTEKKKKEKEKKKKDPPPTVRINFCPRESSSRLN